MPFTTLKVEALPALSTVISHAPVTVLAHDVGLECVTRC